MHLDGAGMKDCDHWHDDAGNYTARARSAVAVFVSGIGRVGVEAPPTRPPLVAGIL